MNRDTRARRLVRRLGRIVVVATLVAVLALSQSDVAWGGLNGDGNPDAVFANDGQTNQRCLGDGAGGFACAAVSVDANDSRGVAVGDLNGDGNVDAVFANDNQTNRRCLGDGAGGFACAAVSADANNSEGVALTLEEQQPPREPVGGIVVPVNRLGLVAPWMGLVGLISLAALAVAVVRRRRIG